jgi:hypothetical protein
VFPGWKFAPADTVIVNCLHGALLIAPRHSADVGGTGLTYDRLALVLTAVERSREKPAAAVQASFSVRVT